MRGLIALTLAAVAASAFFLLARSPSPDRDSGIERVDDAVTRESATTPEIAELPVDEGGDRIAAASDVEVPVVEPSAAPEHSGEDATHGIRVRVVDESGTPLPGIDVEIICRISGNEGEWASETSRAPDGIALFDFEKLSKRLEQLTLMKLEPTLLARADIPSPLPITVEFENGLQDGSALYLVLASTGSVVVRVLDAEGDLFLGDASVYFWWAPAEERLREPDGAMRRVGRHHRSTTDGTARVDGIGLGVVLSFTVWSEGLEGGSLDNVAGPESAGDERIVDLQLGPPRPVIRFQALRLHGASLSGTRFDAQFIRLPAAGEVGLRPSPSPHHERGTTDLAGHARLLTSAHTWTVDRELDVVFRGTDGPPNDDPEWRIATVPLPRDVGPSTTIDLGVIRARPVPVLAEGVVVDESGAPLPGVDLRFLEIYGGERKDSKNLRDGRIKSDEDGRFRLRGTRAPAALGVSAYIEGFDSLRSFDLPVGSRNVVLEMKRKIVVEPEPTGQIALELKMEPGTPFLRLGLYWKSPGASHSTECPPAGVGPFELKNLPPGSYSVWIKSRDGHIKFGRVDNVVVAAGETTRDPRLLPLDLTDAFRTVEIQLVHPSGTPLHKARPTIILDEVRKSFGVRCGKDGRAAFVVPPEVTRIAVAIDKESRVEVSLPSEPGTIRIEIP